MQTYQSIFALALFVLLGLTACNRDEINPDADPTASEDLITFQNMMEDTEDQEELILETRGGGNTDCPTVTITPNDGTYPRTILIDFGNDGCEGPHGRIRTGQIQITVTDTIINAGAVRTTELINFHVDDVWVQGTKTLTNMGPNNDDLLEFTRTIVDGSLTFPNGDEATFDLSHTIVRTDEGDPGTVLDNVFEITGGALGVTRNNNFFTADITEPLVKRRNCRWIVSGIRTITVSDNTFTIDYGDGECDRKADVTGPNGNTFTVLIRRWW